MNQAAHPLCADNTSFESPSFSAAQEGGPQPPQGGPPATTGRATVISCTYGGFPNTVCMLGGRGIAKFYELII